MGFDLPATDNCPLRVDGYQEAPPVQAGGVDLYGPNQGADGWKIGIKCGAQVKALVNCQC